MISRTPDSLGFQGHIWKDKQLGTKFNKGVIAERKNSDNKNLCPIDGPGWVRTSVSLE